MDATTLGTSRETSSARCFSGLAQVCAHSHPLIISERSSPFSLLLGLKLSPHFISINVPTAKVAGLLCCKPTPVNSLLPLQ